MNIGKLAAVFILAAVLSGCKTVDEEQIRDQRTARVNIVNSTNHQIFEVYFQKDTMPDKGDNLITMVIDGGSSRSFDVEAGKYKMIVVFMVNDVSIPIQYNDLLLPNYEYAWKITEETVDLPETGLYEGYIFDLGTDASLEEPGGEEEEIIPPEEPEEEPPPEE